MDGQDLNALFIRILETYEQVPKDIESEQIKKVFTILVSSTLRYRDNLKADLGIILTVEDVRCALTDLVNSIHGRNRRDTDNRVCMELYKLWTDELKDFL